MECAKSGRFSPVSHRPVSHRWQKSCQSRQRAWFSAKKARASRCLEMYMVASAICSVLWWHFLSILLFSRLFLFASIFFSLASLLPFCSSLCFMLFNSPSCSASSSLPLSPLFLLSSSSLPPLFFPLPFSRLQSEYFCWLFYSLFSSSSTFFFFLLVYLSLSLALSLCLLLARC